MHRKTFGNCSVDEAGFGDGYEVPPSQPHKEGYLNKMGATLLLIALTAIPSSASSLQVYAGVVAGSTNSCDSGGATPTAITSFFGSDTTGFGLPLTGNGISSCGLSGQINNLTQSAGPLNTAYNLNNAGFNTGASFSGSASAYANYGSVGVSASGTLTGVAGETGLAENAAFGIAADTINVAGTGSGFMIFDFTYDGTMTIGTPANGGAGQSQVEVQLGNTSQEIFYSNLSGTSVGVEGEEVDPMGQIAFGEPVPGCVIGSATYTCTNATFQTSELPVDFGVPTTFAFGLLTALQANASQTLVSDPPNMSLTGIRIFDAAGNPISDFTITSGSGAVYGADGIESEPANAPEPATFLLAGCALVALGGKRWRKKA